MPPTRSTNVWPAATKTDERRDDEDRLDAVGAREAWVEERADDEDEDRCAEGDENVGGGPRSGDRPCARRRSLGLSGVAHALALRRRPRMAPRRTARTRNRPWKKDW